MDDEEYEVVPAPAVAASKVLVDMKTRLGNPDDPYSKQGKKLMDIMIAVWEDLWPSEAKKWHEDRREYQVAEMTIKEQVHKRTGRSLASIPYPIYELMRKLFPTYKLSHRDDYIKLVKHYPIFRFANKV